MDHGGVSATRARAAEDGLTLIELGIALLLFSVLSAAMLVTFGRALVVVGNARGRSVAANLAQREMETTRNMRFADVPAGRVERTRSVEAIEYTIVRDAQWIEQDASSDPCAGGGMRPNQLRVTVSVSWATMGAVQPVRQTTVLTPPVGGFDRYTGHIAATVRNASAAPVPGHVVAVRDGAGTVRTMATTSQGCALFTFLPAGEYTVSLSTPGHVDGAGMSAPSQATTVEVGATKTVRFDYDTASTLLATLDGMGALPASGLPVTVTNTKLLPSGTKATTGVGNPRTIPGLFPYADGYQLFAGSCADADPEGVDGEGDPFYPGAARGAVVQAPPGGTSSTRVVLPAVTVRVVNALGLPVAGAAVQATHAADNGCPSGATVPLGLTGPTGELRAALPYGTWTFGAAGVGPASRTLSPLDTASHVVEVRP